MTFLYHKSSFETREWAGENQQSRAVRTTTPHLSFLFRKLLLTHYLSGVVGNSTPEDLTSQQEYNLTIDRQYWRQSMYLLWISYHLSYMWKSRHSNRVGLLYACLEYININSVFRKDFCCIYFTHMDGRSRKLVNYCRYLR